MSLNQRITGHWAKPAPRSINLNAVNRPAGSAAAAALRKQEEAAAAEEGGASTGEQSTTEAAASALEMMAHDSTSSSAAATAPSSPAPTAAAIDVATPTASPAPNAVASSSKRKLRSTTANGSSSSSKRSRKPLSADDIADKYAPPTTSLADMGGIDAALLQMFELIVTPLSHPEIYIHTGIKPPRGVLLHGPPGCGKTMLAGAVAAHMQLPFLSVSAPSIVSGTSGESEATLRQTFEEAARIAPAILFIDEIDAITPKRETAGREMERRIVAQLLTCLDDLSWDKTDGKPVMVIGATNRPDSIDPALRRAGRFDHEIPLGVPDEDGREHILRVLAKKLRLSGDFNFRALAKATPGYVGADLTALTSAAGIIAVKRIFNELAEQPVGAIEASSNHDVDMAEGEAARAVQESMQQVTMNGDSAHQPIADDADPSQSTSTPSAVVPRKTVDLFASMTPKLANSSIVRFLMSHPEPLTPSQLDPIAITNADFLVALPTIQPSSKREGFATVPDVSWADIGALHDTREELSMAIVEPIKRPELFAAAGIQASSGVLLWGPPGCGKTLLAKAVANESRANFISVKGPELLNKYVGESERSVRQLFSRARTSAPCVIFFDELDALVPRRDDSLSESSSRVVNTLLTELDGLESRGQVFVIAATNRPDRIDEAMCRPGRLDKLLYIDLPSKQERTEILKTISAKLSKTDGLDIDALGEEQRLDGFSGADLANWCREAGNAALKEELSRPVSAAGVDGVVATPQIRITREHFLSALQKVSPSVSVQQRKKYAQLRSKLSGSPAGRGKRFGEEKEREEPEVEADSSEKEQIPFITSEGPLPERAL